MLRNTSSLPRAIPRCATCVRILSSRKEYWRGSFTVQSKYRLFTLFSSTRMSRSLSKARSVPYAVILRSILFSFICSGLHTGKPIHNIYSILHHRRFFVKEKHQRKPVCSTGEPPAVHRLKDGNTAGGLWRKGNCFSIWCRFSLLRQRAPYPKQIILRKELKKWARRCWRFLSSVVPK